MRIPFLLIIAVIFFTSCQKEFNPPDLVLQGPTGGMITAYKLISADDPGKGYLTKFQYDDQKRVSAVISIEFDTTSGAPKKDSFLIERFTYTGTSDLPDTRIATYYTSSDTTWYQYSNGALVKDSMVYMGTTLRRHLVAYTNTGYKVLSQETGQVATIDSSIINGNNMDYFNRQYVGYAQYTQIIQMTYDVASNPLYDQNIRKVRFYSDMSDIGLPYYSSRNVLKSYTQSGYQSGTFTITNEFNSAEKIVKQTLGSNNKVVATITFEY
jgi:hypothetical protein